MIQEIITYLILAITIGFVVWKLIIKRDNKNCDKNVSCTDCPLAGECREKKTQG